MNNQGKVNQCHEDRNQLFSCELDTMWGQLLLTTTCATTATGKRELWYDWRF